MEDLSRTPTPPHKGRGQRKGPACRGAALSVRKAAEKHPRRHPHPNGAPNARTSCPAAPRRPRNTQGGTQTKGNRQSGGETYKRDTPTLSSLETYITIHHPCVAPLAQRLQHSETIMGGSLCVLCVSVSTDRHF